MTIVDWIPGFEHKYNGRGAGGTYTGGPVKLVIHTFETDPGRIDYAISVMRSRSAGVYHVLVDPGTRRVVQILPTNKACSALRNGPDPVQTNRDSAIQICIVGRAADMDDLSDDTLRWLGEAVVAPIKRAIPQINLDNLERFYGEGEGIVLARANSPVRMSISDWDNFDGICGHQHVPDSNDHWDPGALDVPKIVEYAKALLTPVAAPVVPHRLNSNQILEVNQIKQSPSGNHLLILQSDGNLVLYTAGGSPLWATGTNGQQAHLFVMQGDGNAVIYGTNNSVLWDSKTYGNYGAFLQVQDDGNLVIYNADAQPIWQTGVPGQNPTVVIPSQEYPVLKKGSRGASVMLLQEKLRALGTKLYIDGIFGSQTDRAIRQIQTFFNLTVDGVVGPKTWELLDYLLSRQGK